MSAIEHLSEALAGAVGLAGESVIRVEGRRRIPSSGIGWGEDGLIVTAHHTVERASEVKIGLPDGGAAMASVVGRDPATDVAVLRAPAAGWKPLARAEMDEVRVGHLALAIGRPGDDLQATLGIVSAKEGGWRSPLGGQLEHFLQSDVVMYPGFSGGPLIDARGRLLGMNTSALVRGVALAIPAPTIARVVQALVEHGRVRRGYLGVVVQPVRLSAPAAGRPDQTTGLLVASVESAGPAEKGGILQGDVLIRLGETALMDMEDLLAALSGEVVGRATPIEVVRAGKQATVQVTIGERTPPMEEEA